MCLVRFPNCKINLGLSVLAKRSDGFHELETVFYPVPFTDVLEVISVPASPAADLSFTASGISVAGSVEDNLCVKAYRLLKQDFPHLPAVQMHLHKIIPVGAGLGGGSADGAFALQVLNELGSLQLTQSQLIAYAARLGSDCPFFMLNRPCAGRGRGELLEEVAVDLSRYTMVLVNPHIHVNTGWAFSQLKLQRGEKSSPVNGVRQPVETWRDQLINDFEEPVFQQHPAIQAIRDRLYEQGAIYAAMSGSGSTVFGIFPKKYLYKPDLFPHYFVHHIA